VVKSGLPIVANDNISTSNLYLNQRPEPPDWLNGPVAEPQIYYLMFGEQYTLVKGRSTAGT